MHDDGKIRSGNGKGGPQREIIGGAETIEASSGRHCSTISLEPWEENTSSQKVVEVRRYRAVSNRTPPGPAVKQVG